MVLLHDWRKSSERLDQQLDRQFGVSLPYWYLDLCALCLCLHHPLETARTNGLVANTTRTPRTLAGLCSCMSLHGTVAL